MTKPSADQAQSKSDEAILRVDAHADISLADAILDLLDNCLDGAMRLG